MAPRRTSEKDSSAPRKKSVMDLAQKLKILDLLSNGEKVAAVARKISVNESTIRSIRDNGEKIRESTAQLGLHAKCCKICRGARWDLISAFSMLTWFAHIWSLSAGVN
ncbi:hypothetical protein TKK_0010138 [Trichogramma kaykai]